MPSIYDIGASNEQKTLDKIVAKELVELMIEIGLLTKKFVAIGAEQMNTIGSQGKTFRNKEFISEKEVKSLEREIMSS